MFSNFNSSISFSEHIFIELDLLLCFEIATDAILLFGTNCVSSSMASAYELWKALELILGTGFSCELSISDLLNINCGLMSSAYDVIAS